MVANGPAAPGDRGDFGQTGDRTRGGDQKRKGPADGRALLHQQRADLSGLLLVQRLPVDLQDGLVLRRDREWDHTGNEPLGPHLAGLVLEVCPVLSGEVREAPWAL